MTLLVYLLIDVIVVFLAVRILKLLFKMLNAGFNKIEKKGVDKINGYKPETTMVPAAPTTPPILVVERETGRKYWAYPK